MDRRISFHYQTREFSFKDRRKVKSLLLQLFASEGVGLEKLAYIFCTDTYLLQINREFLQHETLTDVITFQYTEPPTSVESEVYISTDRIKENARQFGYPFSHELIRVMIHGALHLCGYDDKSAAARKRMTTKENQYLRLYLVSRGTN